MEGHIEELYVWVFFLLAPICLVYLRALDRSLLRSPSAAREPPLWGGAQVVAVTMVWFGANVLASGVIENLAPDLEVPEKQCLALSGVLLIVVLSVVSYLRASGQPLATLGLRRTHEANVFVLPLFFLLSFLLLQPCFWSWEFVLNALGYEAREQDVLKEFRAAVESGRRREQLLFTITATVLAPVTEEVVFRGVFFGGLVCRRGFWLAAVSSSLVFALVHFSLSALVPLFLVGLVLCYLYRKTGSLYPSILYHAMFNGLTLALLLWS